MDRFTTLHIFRRVAEYSSFSQAAERLNLSQPVVSKAIRQLEKELAIRLFHRTTRHVSLTEGGEIYYRKICRILDELEAADLSAADIDAVPSGLLRVSVPMTFSVVTLTPRIPAFLARYPEIRLDLYMDDRSSDFLSEGYDLAIRANSPQVPDSSLVARKMMTMEHQLVASPDYIRKYGRITRPEQLADHQAIQFSLTAHANLWTFTKQTEVIKIPVNGRYRVSSSLGVLDAVRAGVGYSLIPQIYIADDIAQGRLETVLDEWAKDKTNVFVLYPSRLYLPAKTRAFIEFLQEIYAP